MLQAVTTAPVPIRLAYRYPNGSMVSYNARAVTHDERIIRAVVNEQFEPGVSLAVMAPFLKGLQTALVASVIRSKKQPGYFEVLLALGDVPVGSGGGISGTSEGSRSGERNGNGGQGAAELPQRRNGEQIPPKRWTLATVSEEMEESARQLGNYLEVVPPRRFSEAMERIPPESRSSATVIAAAAVLHLFEKKGVVPAWQLVRGTKKRMRK